MAAYEHLPIFKTMLDMKRFRGTERSTMNKKIVLSWSFFLVLSLVLMFSHMALAAFQDNGDGTVTDTVTGLMWQQSDDGNGRTWQEALDYCEGLEYADSADWRLPNVRELESLVDWDRCSLTIDPVFVCHSSYCYWSGSTYAYFTDRAWYVDFNEGDVCSKNKDDYRNYVRCARGGPDKLFGDLDIKANGQDGPIVVTPGDQISIEVSLDPGDKVGQNADWWIAATTPFAPPRRLLFLRLSNWLVSWYQSMCSGTSIYSFSF